MKPITFTLHGNPVPKGRPRVFRRKNGGGTVTITPERTVRYESAVGLAAMAAGVRRADGPVSVELHFHLPTRRRADVDNLAKSILDGLNGVAYADDAQVERLLVTKSFDALNPRAVVTVAGFAVNDSEPFDASEHERPARKAGGEG